MTIQNMMIIVITWHFLLGTFLIIRWLLLSKRFKKSDYTDFLEFFEREYLEKTEPTWRQKYTYIYRSSIYKLGHYVGAFCCYLLSAGLIAVIIYIYSEGYGELLTTPM